MTIYVENGELMCSPFGREKGFDMVYKGVNPLAVKAWQHISCTFSNKAFVKGQYLVLDLDSDDFARRALQPQSFGLVIAE